MGETSARVPLWLAAMAVFAGLPLLLVACGGSAGARGEAVATVVPRTLPAPASEPLSRKQMDAVLEVAGWPEEVRSQALLVAGCESSWDPATRGDAGELGLFQIHPAHGWRFQSLFGALADPRSPVQNAVVAREIWAAEAWEPWTCQPETRY